MQKQWIQRTVCDFISRLHLLALQEQYNINRTAAGRNFRDNNRHEVISSRAFLNTDTSLPSQSNNALKSIGQDTTKTPTIALLSFVGVLLPLLTHKDSNLDKQNQNLLCCHYTMSQSVMRFLRIAVQSYRFFPILQ